MHSQIFFLPVNRKCTRKNVEKVLETSFECQQTSHIEVGKLPNFEVGKIREGHFGNSRPQIFQEISRFYRVEMLIFERDAVLFCCCCSCFVVVLVIVVVALGKERYVNG